MKTIKTNFFSSLMAFSLCVGVLSFSNCSNDDDGDDEVNPDVSCEELDCLNGGNAIEDVELGTCRCICPTGYSGENCETKD